MGSQYTVLIDGFCPVCTGWAAFINKRDSSNQFSVVAQETTEGEEVLSNRPAKMRELDSVFLIDESGKWYAQSTAVIRILLGLGFPYNFGAIIWFIPSPIRNFAYDIYARNRKRTPSNS